MAKRYREFLEEVKKAKRHRSDTDPNWEMKPKDSKTPKVSAPGEQEFIDKHAVQDKPYPVDGTDDVVNARNMKKTNKHDPDKDRAALDAAKEDKPKQGNSPVVSFDKWTGKAPTTRTPARRGDKHEGDSPTKPLRLSPSAVDPNKKDGINEDASVYAQLKFIAEDNTDILVTFNDGGTAVITPDTAKRLLTIESKLSKPNAAMFRRKLDESPTSVVSLLNLGGR